MKWHLSMSYAKLISKTADAGSAKYTLGAPGQLNPGKIYYWHVRAQDSKGVWGAWSKTWSFTPHGPAFPVDVTLQFDREKNAGVLRWAPNPLGSRPVAYRIYASDEKAFSTSDESYRVTTGVSKELPTQFPANFIAETTATELAVIGLDVAVAGANKAYYRVLAVDKNGKRSGPSDYAEAPRPVIFSQPVARGKLGADYQYQLAAIRSLGDLRTRVVDGKETMNFWDVEKPRYTLNQAPEWLKLDAATGRLSGKPDRQGRVEVIVSATLDRPLHRLDEADLKWGREKVVASGTESYGSAKQAFVIDVEP
jgi:hypothetical protein